MTIAFVLISFSFVLLERIRPWRKDQRVFRKGWLTDLAHITFNGYLFHRFIYSGLALFAVVQFSKQMKALGVWDYLHSAVMQDKPIWIQFLVLFFVQDFLKWCVHSMLHRVPFLWEFHKVHHSIRTLDWIGNMRYHWIEVVIYNSMLYIPLTFLGFQSSLFFYVGIIEIVIGHFNHSNIDINLKWLGYFLNSPRFHIWHHADEPEAVNKNFGIVLSVWDWLFGTAYMPAHRVPRDLGFEGIDKYPSHFLSQQLFPISQLFRSAPTNEAAQI